MKARWLLVGLVSTLLLALASCGGTTTASSGSTTPTASGPVSVQVTLNEFKILSSLTTFKVGVPYHFVVTNTGQTVHEFMAGPIAKATASEDERDAAKLFEVAELETGKSGTADYTFTQPYAAGVMEFACHVSGHYESGMRLDFTVTA
jgi:uncharacterized cupredoxin-like copper-binding protein